MPTTDLGLHAGHGCGDRLALVAGEQWWHGGWQWKDGCCVSDGWLTLTGPVDRSSVGCCTLFTLRPVKGLVSPGGSLREISFQLHRFPCVRKKTRFIIFL